MRGIYLVAVGGQGGGPRHVGMFNVDRNDNPLHSPKDEIDRDRRKRT